MIDAVSLKGCFVTVNIIRIFFTDCLHIGKQNTWMQQIIMIKQCNIISCCHFITFICIPGNTLIFDKLLILDPAVLLPVFLTDPADKIMRIIGTVRQAKLPFTVGLCGDRLDHFPQETLRCVIERHKNTECHILWENGCFLFFPFCHTWKAARSMDPDRFLFPVFGQKLMRNTLGIAVAQDPVLCCDTIIDDHSGRLCKLPEYRTLDLVQLSCQILHFPLAG